MQISRYLNCTESDISNKKFNIFIGISIGNKFFSKENLREYLRWALENTKDDVIFVLADSIHAINYEVFNGYSPEKALRHALVDSERMVGVIGELVSELPPDKKKLVSIVKWQELQKSGYYSNKKPLITEEFKNNSEFKNNILEIVRENLGERAVGLDNDQISRLAEYVLDEIPIMVNGIHFKDKIYNLYPYPFIAKYDALLLGLYKKGLFKNLAENLEIDLGLSEVEMK